MGPVVVSIAPVGPSLCRLLPGKDSRVIVGTALTWMKGAGLGPGPDRERTRNCTDAVMFTCHEHSCQRGVNREKKKMAPKRA